MISRNRPIRIFESKIARAKATVSLTFCRAFSNKMSSTLKIIAIFNVGPIFQSKVTLIGMRR